LSLSQDTDQSLGNAFGNPVLGDADLVDRIRLIERHIVIFINLSLSLHFGLLRINFLLLFCMRLRKRRINNSKQQVNQEKCPDENHGQE